MEPIHASILHELRSRIGKRNAISRDELCLAVSQWLDSAEVVSASKQDRQVREAIEWLRANHPEGCWIVSSSGWKGYWMAESEDEVLKFCASIRSTGIKMVVNARKQKALLAEISVIQQMEMAI